MRIVSKEARGIATGNALVFPMSLFDVTWVDPPNGWSARTVMPGSRSVTVLAPRVRVRMTSCDRKSAAANLLRESRLVGSIDFGIWRPRLVTTAGLPVRSGRRPAPVPRWGGPQPCPQAGGGRDVRREGGAQVTPAENRALYQEQREIPSRGGHR
jgi:hypothetical protein